MLCISPFGLGMGRNAIPSGLWEESRGRCTWPRLSFAGCGECLTVLTIGYHVQLNMKPAFLLNFLRSNHISVAFQVRSRRPQYACSFKLDVVSFI